MARRRISRKQIGDGDAVVLYPTIGHPIAGGSQWRVQVSGTVYDGGAVSLRKRLLLRLLQKMMKVPPEAFEDPRFQDRVRAFLAPTEPGKRVVVRVAGRLHRLPRGTNRQGRFLGTIRLDDRLVRSLAADGGLADGWLPLEVVTAGGLGQPAEGRAQLIGRTGVSVISDIDDTLKLTGVHCRPTMLANTFLHEFRAVDGMAEVFRGWSDAGAVVHYVSTSPWQLYEPLAELFQLAGLPLGTFHLQSFRLRDHVLRKLPVLRLRGKASAIRHLLRTFPDRRFLLVGDSGQWDPEIYGAAARRFPRQVQRIMIRELPHRPLDPPRCRKVFRGLPADCWTVFRSPAELPGELEEAVAAAGPAHPR